MTIDHTYRGVTVLTLSGLEDVIDRLLVAERARDEARTAIKQALEILHEEKVGGAVRRARMILDAANRGLQPGERNAENPQGPTMIETNANALMECPTCGFDVRTDVHSHRCKGAR